MGGWLPLSKLMVIRLLSVNTSIGKRRTATCCAERIEPFSSIRGWAFPTSKTL